MVEQQPCVKNLRVPTSERPSHIDGVKRYIGKTIDACTAYITTNMNWNPDIW